MALASQIILIALVFTAGVYDIKWRRIPNWLALTGLLLGAALNGFLFEWAGVKATLLGVGFAFLIYFPLYLLRGMGAGDVKLMMAIGAIVGPGTWFGIFLTTGIIGGLVAVLLLVARRRLQKTFWNVRMLLDSIVHFRAPYANPELDVRSAQGLRMPHGAVIAVGTVAFLALGRILH
jgi:prepilin peptidase CpaA